MNRVTVRFAMSQEQEEELRAANERVYAAERELSAAAEARRTTIRRVLESGATQTQIAEVLGVSQPRVSIMASTKNSPN